MMETRFLLQHACFGYAPDYPGPPLRMGAKHKYLHILADNSVLSTDFDVQKYSYINLVARYCFAMVEHFFYQAYFLQI